MDKTNNKQEKDFTPEWFGQIQIGFLTVLNTYVFFLTVNRLQSNFWRVINVQTGWTLVLGILYSLFFMCVFASFSNLFSALKKDHPDKNTPPVVGSYSLYIGALFLYLLIELMLNFLVAKNAI